jgi:hypothetical protein
MKKGDITGQMILLVIVIVSVLALVFLFKTLQATGQAAIPIPFANWDCSCRGRCEIAYDIPTTSYEVTSRILRPTITEAQVACTYSLRAQCDGILKYSEIVKCEQYSKQAATPW